MEKLSIVVPCYNEEESIKYFYSEVEKINKKMKNVFFEYIFVDDGSRDNTLLEIEELSKKITNFVVKK